MTPNEERRPQPARGVDPAVLLLVSVIREGQAGVRDDMQALAAEIRELRAQAPGRLAFWMATGLVTLSLVAILGLLASRGVDPSVVGGAAGRLLPVLPVLLPPDGALPARFP